MMNKHKPGSVEKALLDVIHKLWGLLVFLLLVIGLLLCLLLFGAPDFKVHLPERDASGFSAPAQRKDAAQVWQAPDTSAIPKDERGAEILYGRSLIANTSLYLGPKGSVAHVSNGLNCQNCHLDAGTRPFGNNYSAVASTYPKFRERSGKTENIYKRVNDCFERSLNGKGLDTNSREMKAIEAYIRWLGKDVKKGVKPAGSGIENLAFLSRPADPQKGRLLFKEKCVSCHGDGGQGKMKEDGLGYVYPPLWGTHSFNTGAGLFRLTRFAGYIRNNMPQGATKAAPLLSAEESWDIAAFVNSQERPRGDVSKDWPNLAAKPIDNPFGPYADSFSEVQHKFGPYAAITEYKEKHKKKSDKK
jgi:thiosulfate dehydrogenase